jgi:acyl-CoA reductase-like NAD-dependent aldehyde dehydrogenase
MATATISRSTEPAAQRGVLWSINPYSGQTLKTFIEMSVEELDRAIATAHERFPSWSRLPFLDRGACSARRLGCAASAGETWRGR